MTFPVKHASRGCGRWMARLACLLTVVALLAAAPAGAAPMPNGTVRVSITARELPLAAFLQNLFGQVNVPVVVSPGVAGSPVSGTFTAPAQQVLREICRAYNLVPYYDGAVMHVVPASELVQRTLSAGPAATDRVVRATEELDLLDLRNTLRRMSDGSLIATGVPRFVTQVEDLLQNGQQAPSSNAYPSDFRVFYLKYAWAQDVSITLGGKQIVLPGVASTLRSLIGVRGGSVNQEILLRPGVLGLRGQGLAGQGVEENLSANGGGDSRADSRNQPVDALVSALHRVAQTPDPATAPPMVLPAADPRQIRIEADPRLNAVIVRDAAERLPRYEQLIASLDVEPQSLEVEATIIDINTDRARELGINWQLSNNHASAGVQNGSDTPILGTGGAISLALNTARQFLAHISALEAQGAARIVSSPQVVTLSNIEANFDNTQTMYVRVAGHSDVDLFPVTAGTVLRVTPRVSRDQSRTQIMLLVHIEDGALSQTQTVDQIPVVENSTISTQALVGEGESLLIGGMVRESTSNTKNQVPLLGDIPVLGLAFRNTQNSSNRVERMFLITPRLGGSRPATSAPTSMVTTSVASVSLPPRTSRVLDLDALGTQQTSR
jgi:type III secretion protein C